MTGVALDKAEVEIPHEVDSQWVQPEQLVAQLEMGQDPLPSDFAIPH